VARVRSPGGGIQRVPIPDCAVTSATFIEDAYRKAVSGAFSELGGERGAD
jgi:hypothetical protein